MNGREHGLRVELADLEHRAGVNLPRVSSGWIRSRLEQLEGLLAI